MKNLEREKKEEAALVLRRSGEKGGEAM